MEIAVVGLGCWLPGAQDPRSFWENVLSRRCQFRRFPKTRLGESLQDESGKDVDKTYATRGAFIDGFEFDWRKHRFPRKTVDVTDPVQLLALEVALQAVADVGSPLPAESTAVVVGNTLAGEVSRANGARLRWPYVRRVLEQVFGDTGALGTLSAAEVEHLLSATEEVYKGNFPAPNEDFLAGTLANTIAGRIANYLNLRGGCHCVDGACASGLLAIDAACQKLISGSADAVVCGGVDMSLDAFEMVGFARVGALTRSEMRVYDSAASGFLAGEGCAMIVLKRLDDAIKAGDHVYALIDGVATSADGKGAMTAPTVSGQALAVDRAYRSSQISMHQLDFIEGHGTGTKAGDPVELRAVASVLRRHLEEAGVPGEESRRHVGMTSIKSLLGHTKAASGAVGFLKVVCALDQGVVPPTFNLNNPNGVFAEGADCDCLYPVLEGEIKPEGAHMRAGVSSMGFGGINVHCVMSSYGSSSPKLAVQLPLPAMLASSQQCELFVLSADSPAGLVQQVSELRGCVGDLAYCELADLAADLARRCQPGMPLRLALLASTPAELEAELDEVARHLAGATLARQGATASHAASPRQRSWLSHVAGPPARVGFLFPGQGSQLLNGAARIVKRHAWAQELVASADCWLSDAGCPPVSQALFAPLDRRSASQVATLTSALAHTGCAQPALALTSLLWRKLLARLSVVPTVVAGHSLGELSALAAAGALTDEQLIVAAGVRGKLMAASKGGGMAALGCSAADAEALIAGAGASDSVCVANKNAPTQTVLSGATSGIEAVVAAAKAGGLRATLLPVSGAFHSPLQAAAADCFCRHLASAPPSLAGIEGAPAVVSSLTGQVLPAGTDLVTHLADQLTSTVDWVSASAALRGLADIFVEVGPKQVVSGLLAANTPAGAASPICLPLESTAGADVDMLCALAQLHTAGLDLCWDEAYAGRFTRPLVRPSDRQFISNPLERGLVPTPATLIAAVQAAVAAQAAPAAAAASSSPLPSLDDHSDTRSSGLLPPLTPEPSLAGPGVSRAMFPAGSATSAQDAAAATAVAVQARVVQLVCEATGFDEASVTPDLRLLDDLNLDSIKIGELTAQLGAELEVDDDALPDPVTIASSSIGELAAALAAAAASSSNSGTTSDAAAPPTRPSPTPPVASTHPSGSPSRSPATAEPAVPALAAPVSYKGVGTGSISRLPDGYINSTPSWVRDFTMKPHPTTLLGRTLPVEKLLPLAIVFSPKQRGAAEGIAAAVEKQHAGAVHLVPLATDGTYPGAPGPLAGCSAAVVLMPGFACSLPTGAGRSADTAALSAATLSTSLALLKRDARQPGGLLPTTLLYAQSGAGHVSPAPRPDADLTSALAFASSVHLERPQMRVRVVDLPCSVPPHPAAACLLAEMSHGGSFVAAGYAGSDAAPERFSPFVAPNDPRTYSPVPAASQLGPGDVVLVTGGGGGITAECALALALATGVRLAMVGRSPQVKVSPTLERLAAAGVSCAYYSADVANAAAVQSLVAAVQQQQGAITGIVHGAAIQTLGRAEAIALHEAVHQIAPKVDGLLNLLSCIDSSSLKLLAAFSSIIGSTGMPGSAWYGFSNECVDSVCRSYKAQYPHCAVSSHGYGVWDEVGMGARMGSVDVLAKMGIAAIPVKEGTQHFVRLALMDTGSTSTIVASRVRPGVLDTMLLPPPKLPTRPLRFTQHLAAHMPGVESAALVQLSTKDPYIRDHVYKNSFLMPTVMGLEAMAQVVAAVTQRTASGLGEWVEVRDVRLDRPITAPAFAPSSTILVWASVVEEEAEEAARDRRCPLPTRVRAGIRTEGSGFKHDHFSAIFVLDGGIDEEEVRSLCAMAGTRINGTSAVTGCADPPAQLLPVDPRSQLYGSGLLFQGPLYQRIAGITSLESRWPEPAAPICVAGLHVLSSADSVVGRDGLHMPGSPASGDCPLMLGDPYFHDALLQASQLTVPECISLPTRVDKWVFRCGGATPLQTGLCPAVNLLVHRSGPVGRETCKNDCIAWDPSGQLLTYSRGAVFKELASREPDVRVSNLQTGDLAPSYTDLNGPPGPGAPTPLDGRALQDLALPCPQAEALVAALRAELAPAGVHLHVYRVPVLPSLTATQRRLHLELPLAQRLLVQAAEGMTLKWEAGKPCLAPFPPPLQFSAGTAAALRAGSAFSISHTGSLLVLAAGSAAVGVDIEQVAAERQDEGHWRRMLGSWAGELQAVLHSADASGNSPDDVATAGCRLWCAKEALFKAVGTVSAKVVCVERLPGNVVCMTLSTQEGLQFRAATAALVAPAAGQRGLVLAVCSPLLAPRPGTGSAQPLASSAVAGRQPAIAGRTAAQAAPVTTWSQAPSKPIKPAGRGLDILNRLKAKRYVSYLPSSGRFSWNSGAMKIDFPILYNDILAQDQSLSFLTYARMISLARELTTPPKANAQVAALAAQGSSMAGITRRCEILELETPLFHERELQLRISGCRQEGIHEFNDMPLMMEVLTAKKPHRVVARVRMLMAFVNRKPMPGGGIKAERATPPPALEELLVLLSNSVPSWKWWPSDRFAPAASVGKLGGLVWDCGGAVVRSWPLLYSEPYVTDQLAGNLTLNTYWMNYVAYGCRTLDRWTTALVTPLLGRERRVTDGYFRLVHSNYHFIHETLPRDALEVQVRLQCVHEHGLRLALVCIQDVPGQGVIKLNEAVCSALWTESTGPCAIPADISAAIVSAAGSASGASSGV